MIHYRPSVVHFRDPLTVIRNVILPMGDLTPERLIEFLKVEARAQPFRNVREHALAEELARLHFGVVAYGNDLHVAIRI